MAHLVHARSTEDGLRFRVWSTVSDSYLTEEMTEEEVRSYTLKTAVCDAIEAHSRDIEERIQRVKTIGTSSMMGDTRRLSEPWDEEQR